MPFSQLGLYSSLVRGAQACGYTEPTPIQLRAIPAVLSGRDLVASAPTGTGKTAAFALPVLNRLGPHRAEGPRVLILEPTRELAVQVETAFRDLGRFTDLKTVVLHGGVGHGPQRNALRTGADIVVATTGRLREFLDGTLIKLDLIEVVILDEVDRMLDMGFIDDVKTIVKLCPPKRQTLLFSATMPPKLQEIARFALSHPERIEIGSSRTVVESVTHSVHPVAAEQKFDLLLALLKTTDYKSVIIFCRTKLGADHIAHCLRVANHGVAILHSNRTQAQRTAALDGFKSGKYGIMIATDIAARGLDVADVSHVINYDVPQHPDDYVHRVGRTGRASAQGDAFTLACPDEAGDVAAIEKFIGQKILQVTLDGFEYEGGKPPIVDPTKSAPPRRAGRQHLGAGGKTKGESGANQGPNSQGRPFGGGNPLRHPKGKPGAHWRKSGGW